MFINVLSVDNFIMAKQPKQVKAKGLMQIFQNGTAAVLDFMCDHTNKDYPLSELSKLTGVSARNIYRVVYALVALEIIKNTRTVGTIRLYQFNIDSHKANALLTCHDSLLTKYT